jgi:hypothetical protein
MEPEEDSRCEAVGQLREFKRTWGGSFLRRAISRFKIS